MNPYDYNQFGDESDREFKPQYLVEREYRQYLDTCDELEPMDAYEWSDQ